MMTVLLPHRRASVLLLTGIWLLCLGVLLAANAWRPRQSAAIYPLAIVWQQTQADPARWVGRTVRVRAMAVPCSAALSGPGSPCLDPRPALIDPDPNAGVLAPLALAPLALAPASSGGLSLAGLPLLGLLFPTPAAPVWGITAIYTIQIRSFPCVPTSSRSCFEVALQ